MIHHYHHQRRAAATPHTTDASGVILMTTAQTWADTEHNAGAPIVATACETVRV